MNHATRPECQLLYSLVDLFTNPMEEGAWIFRYPSDWSPRKKGRCIEWEPLGGGSYLMQSENANA